MDQAALIAGAATLLALSLAIGALLRGWQDWLELRRLELGAGPGHSQKSEVQELRHRVRKLERIALGLD